MQLEVRNKRLLLEKIEDKKQEQDSAFFLSDKLKKVKTENEVFRVLGRAEDCTISISIGSLVLIEGNMIEESKVGEITFLTCKENFIIGVIKE